MRGRDRREPGRDRAAVDESGPEQCAHEVEVLLTPCARFRRAQVMGLEAPSGESRITRWSCGVGCLHLHQAVAANSRQNDRRQVDTVNSEAMLRLE
jgi:hypothetical protein